MIGIGHSVSTLIEAHGQQGADPNVIIESDFNTRGGSVSRCNPAALNMWAGIPPAMEQRCHFAFAFGGAGQSAAQ
jgi:hypothetical protein